MILFCLPYAGGSENIYYSWRGHLDSSIAPEPIGLKGRGKRYDEGFYKDCDDAVNDIYTMIKEKIAKEEYAFFGHSMGSLLAYELYYKINAENLPKPKHLFFSGSSAPCKKKKDKLLHKLPDNEFLEEIIKLGGTPKELLENDELLQLVLPTLRNDFKITENYEFKEKPEKLECNITIFSGKDDDLLTTEELSAWRFHCSLDCKFHILSGDHFFLHNHVENITKIINYTLSP